MAQRASARGDERSLIAPPASSRKKIYAVCWTPKQHKVVPTKKAGSELIRQWKSDYKERGWTVQTLGADAYMATDPATTERHAVVFHEYDAVTRERLWSPPKKREPVSA